MSTNVSTIVKSLSVSNSNASSILSGILFDNNFLKLAVVVDIILDDKHPFFGKTTTNKNSQPPPTVRYQQIPVNYNNFCMAPHILKMLDLFAELVLY